MYSIITGIKIHKKSKNFLSFADDGISINIVKVITKKNFKKTKTQFQELHKFAVSKNYKVYICKDFFLDQKSLEKNYKLSKNFLLFKKKYDPKSLFYSDFLKRVKK